MKSVIIIFLFVLFCFIDQINSQTTQSQQFNFIGNPGSVKDFGMGMQGVASTSSIDALIYNPANLVFTDEPQFSFYHNANQMISNGMPINDYSFNYNAGNIGSFGIDFLNLDQNIAYSIGYDPYNIVVSNYYERSVSIGYAKSLNENLALGADIRYSYGDLINFKYYCFTISAGLNDKFSFIDRDWNIGFSIMNLGPAVRFSFPGLSVTASSPSDSFSVSPNYYSHSEEYINNPPTFLSSGLTVPVYENNFLSIPISVSFSKPFVETQNNGNSGSSFKTLFTDWNDFPNDCSFSSGLAIDWKPIYIGNGFYFSQSYYLGNYPMGVNSDLTNYYTHGAEFKFEYNGIKLNAGYSGVWHNGRANQYFSWNYPYETFQLSISADEKLFSNYHLSSSQYSNPENIIISTGLNQLLRVGIANSQNVGSFDVESKNNLEYSVETAFYFNKYSALVGFISYNYRPFSLNYLNYNWIDYKYENFAAGSLFRYHPVENIRNFFIQGGIGITRVYPVSSVNPHISFSPSYFYIPDLIVGAGYNLEINDYVILTPSLGYTLSLRDSYSNTRISEGENQFNVGFKIGYRINFNN